MMSSVWTIAAVSDMNRECNALSALQGTFDEFICVESAKPECVALYPPNVETVYHLTTYHGRM